MKSSASVNSLTNVLECKAVWPPPIWFMRQAGRYLPEYQAIRKKAGSFWTMCMTPELATEVTLQPIERFDLDAAILFSDILVIPYALGQPVRFEDGVGPTLDAFKGEQVLERDLAAWEKKLQPVYAAMRAARSRLAEGKSLIGFAGAPWTLAAYMLQGRGSPDQRAAKLFAYQQPDRFSDLLDILVDIVVFHLSRQLEAGADTLQLFDSWAAGLPDEEFGEWVIEPAAKIVAGVRERHSKARIIGFPRAATQTQYERYVTATRVDGISIDTATSIGWAAEVLGNRVAIQGNLDPVVLIAGGNALDSAVDRILREARSGSLIFNLGHGVLPETPVANVSRVVERVRAAT
jgi:uroporphyrinogen decarboxylase